MDFAPGAKKYGIPLIFIALFVWILSPPLSLAIIALAGFVFAFFRDPKRTPPSSGIISPADGKVSVIRKEDDRIRVGVFMNVTNVHVNCSVW